MSLEAASISGIIIKSQGGFYVVRTDIGDLFCRGRGLFRKSDTVLVVGDRVRVRPTGSGEGSISELEPRKNSLIRPPVSNIDRLAIVVSAAQPDPNTYIIDKLTAIAARRSIPVVIIFTKDDLADISGLADIYTKAGYAVYVVNAPEGKGLDEIRQLFSTGITSLCGNSGAGKSTLMNALYPGLSLETAEISKKLGRGKHTTRHVELFETENGFIADTPGFSAIEFIQFEKMMASELEKCFPEFEPYLGKCRFTGCAHNGAKGCAVCEALEKGEISKSRYESYLALYNELKDLKEWELK